MECPPRRGLNEYKPSAYKRAFKVYITIKYFVMENLNRKLFSFVNVSTLMKRYLRFINAVWPLGPELTHQIQGFNLSASVELKTMYSSNSK